MNAQQIADIILEAKSKFDSCDEVPTIVLAGRTGSGKSSLMNAMAGRFVSETGVIPTTQTPVEHELTEGGLPLRVVDLPGVGEAGRHAQRLEHMLESLVRAHILLVTVPCASRDLAYEREVVGAVQTHFGTALPLPCIVACTKIDAAAPVRDWNPVALNLASPASEKERNIVAWLDYVERTMGPHIRQPFGGATPFLPCCAGESWERAEERYGIEALRYRIYESLPDAARTYFARLDGALCDRRAADIIFEHSVSAAMAGLNPLPGIPDALFIVPIQIGMLVRLSRLYARPFTWDVAVRLLGPLLARSAGRMLASQLCKFVPVAGSLAGAAVAGALTYCLGMAFHALMHGGSWTVDADVLLREVEKVWNGMDIGVFLKELKRRTGITFPSWKG